MFLSNVSRVSEFVLGDDQVAAGLLRLIERAIAAFDQVIHGFAELELTYANRHGNARQNLAGRAPCDLALGDGAANAFRRGGRCREVRAGKNGDQLFAAIARRKIDLPTMRSRNAFATSRST